MQAWNWTTLKQTWREADNGTTDEKNLKHIREEDCLWCERLKKNLLQAKGGFFFGRNTAQNETVYFEKVKIFRQVVATFSDSWAIFIHDDYTTKKAQVNEMISFKNHLLCANI